MPEIKHFAMGADAHTIVNAIKEDGAIILDNVISTEFIAALREDCLLYTSPSPRDVEESRMPSSA